MASRVTSWLSWPFRLPALLAHLRLAVRLVREPRVSLVAKALPLLATLYVISPLDLVPDVVPGLGQLDDLGIILLALQGFLRLCPAEAVTFHRAAISQGRSYSPMSPTGGVIDAEWRRED
jgi:uncharacterized membrane protein YkvA (DUF1232 family)